MSMIDLPTRKDLKLAISPWWRGGGVAEMLVDSLRGSEADIATAQIAAPHLVDIAERGYHITKAMVDEEVEKALAVSDRRRHTSPEGPTSPNPRIGGDEWIRRATERAVRNESSFERWGGYDKALKTVTWEKPAKQQKAWMR